MSWNVKAALSASSAVLLLSLLALPSAAGNLADPLAPAGRWTADHGGMAATPPMGWNSWNAFRTEITEEKVIGSADALIASGLAKTGYVYVNVDDGWWLKRRPTDGRLEIRTSIFPSAQLGSGQTSFKPFVDRLHKMGLKAGIYTDIGRNACSQAWDPQSPNLPVGTTAEREVGLEGHVDQDIHLFFKDWGFDYIKVDACGVADFMPGAPALAAGYRAHEPVIVRSFPEYDDAAGLKARYAAVADALNASNADGKYFLSICTWGRANVRAWGTEVGNAWRTSADISPVWTSMLHSYDSVVTRALYAHPGSWNDPDMLYVGTGDFDEHHLVAARTHFTLWAMVNAPLLIGYDLRHAPKALLDILGNTDVVAVNQDKLGNQAVPAYRSDDVHILVKSLANGKKAVALFNRREVPIKVTLTSAHLKFASGTPIVLRNLWTKETLPPFSGETTFTLQPQETLALEATGTHLLERGVYLSEMPGRIHVAADGIAAPEMDPEIYHASLGPTLGSGEKSEYAGWGGAQADASPYSTALASANVSFAYGLGVLSNSRLEVRTEGQYARFAARVGVDNSTRNRQTAIRFIVYGDGRKLGETGPLKFGDAPVDIQVATAGSKVIELVAKSTGPESAPVAVNWGDARLEN